MRHDPELLAARFLDGTMRRPDRWRYERHLVECPQCWTHVRQARAGRSSAESLRLAAPARVRERVRAIPELADNDTVVRRRSDPSIPVLVTLAAVLVAVLVGVMTHDDGTRADDAVAEVAAAYRDSAAWAVSAAPPPSEQLSGLRWVETLTTTIDDDQVLGYRYTDDHGTTVLVVQRDGRFEAPTNAEPAIDGDWTTRVDGITVLCTLPPDPRLVVGTDPTAVQRIATALTRPIA